MSEYLIWSNEHSAWWGPGGNGYVHRVEYAGRSSQERAMIICTHAMLGRRGHAPLQELPVRLEDVGEIRLSTLCGSSLALSRIGAEAETKVNAMKGGCCALPRPIVPEASRAKGAKITSRD